MDDRHFDALTRVLTAGGSRRRLLGLLATLPILGGLLGILLPEETDARGRRKRRKKRHKHGKRRRSAHGRGKKKCRAESYAQTCAGTCGSVTNNCQKPVDCGSCACDPLCAVCLTCDAATGQCIPDASQQGDDCGEAGQVCLANGTCSCSPLSCPACATCQDSGLCTDPCDGSGCCDGATCQPGATDLACGRDGETCAPCTGQDVCTGGVCVCVPACAGKCGGADDGCGGTCTGSCPSRMICDDQTCQACDVCSGCTYTELQEAVAAVDAGSVVRVCAGSYTSPNGTIVEIEKNLTIIGAGSGDGGTVIDGNDIGRGPALVRVLSGAVELRDLAITGGDGVDGGGISNRRDAILTLTRVVISDNYGRYGGGIANYGTVTLNAGTLMTRNSSTSGGGINNIGTAILNAGSRITDNGASGDGGGIYNEGSVTLNPGSSVDNNNPTNCENVNSGIGCPSSGT